MCVFRRTGIFILRMGAIFAACFLHLMCNCPRAVYGIRLVILRLKAFTPGAHYLVKTDAHRIRILDFPFRYDLLSTLALLLHLGPSINLDQHTCDT